MVPWTLTTGAGQPSGGIPPSRRLFEVARCLPSISKMPPSLRRRGIIKFSFWALVAAATITGTVRSYLNGQMAEWYYHRAAIAGYAVNAELFKNATKSNPAILKVATGDEINGLQAIRVERGDLLPRHTNGIISDEIVAQGRRAFRSGMTIQVLVPWEVKESKGFKFRDTFKHKGIRTWPWAGVWNVVIVALLGLSLGLMAEGFTDMLGLKLEKIRHHGRRGDAHV
jgi:hypothetical protein